MSDGYDAVDEIADYILKVKGDGLLEHDGEQYIAQYYFMKGLEAALRHPDWAVAKLTRVHNEAGCVGDGPFCESEAGSNCTATTDELVEALPIAAPTRAE
jgi:hypothetical protein